MNDEERLRTLVRALLPFALAADDPDARKSNSGQWLLIYGDDGEQYPVYYIDKMALEVGDLRAAADALRAAGYADALTDDSARAALGGEDA